MAGNGILDEQTTMCQGKTLRLEADYCDSQQI
jgi:hypothetical protein